MLLLLYYSFIANMIKIKFNCDANRFPIKIVETNREQCNSIFSIFTISSRRFAVINLFEKPKFHSQNYVHILSFYTLRWNYETNNVHAMKIAKMSSKSSTNTKSCCCCCCFFCLHDIALMINNSSAPHVFAQTVRFITEWMEKRSRMTHRYPISAH